MLDQNEDLKKHTFLRNRENFGELFRELFPKLYHFSYDIVKDKEIASDIVHESFIRLWESGNNLKPDSNIEAVLITICRNQCLNFLKHKKVILRFQENAKAALTEVGLMSGVLNNSSLDRIDYILLQEKLSGSIRNLPEQCRKVFELSRFKRKKYSEIGEILKISVKTVEAHMSLALKRLREDLKDFL